MSCNNITYSWNSFWRISGHFCSFWAPLHSFFNVCVSFSGVFLRFLIQIWGLFGFDSILLILLMMPNFSRIGRMFYFQHLEFEKCCYQLSIKEIIIITRERNAIKAHTLLMRARKVISAKSPLQDASNFSVFLIDFWCIRVKSVEYSWR